MAANWNPIFKNKLHTCCTN